MKKTIKIDEKLHRILKSRATLQGVSLIDMVETILAYASNLDDLHKSLIQKGEALLMMTEKLQQAQKRFQQDIADRIDECLGTDIPEEFSITFEDVDLNVDDLLDMVRIYGNDILTDEEKKFLEDNL